MHAAIIHSVFTPIGYAVIRHGAAHTRIWRHRVHQVRKRLATAQSSPQAAKRLGRRSGKSSFHSFKPKPQRGGSIPTSGLKEILMKPRDSILALGILLFSFATQAREAKTTVLPLPSPVAIVQAQLDAYNRHDLETFLSFYSDDAVLVNYPDQITQTGKAQMRDRYERRFAMPNVHAEIIQRIVFSNFVIDYERITAPPTTDVIEAVATYEVRNGKIIRVTFLAK